MSVLVTKIGKEYILKTNTEGASIQLGMYNDSTDGITNTSDVGSITTEPSGSAYARQSDTLVTEELTADWQSVNSSDVSFDTTDSSESVDCYFILASFQSATAGDSSSTLHLIAVGNLDSARNLSNFSTVTLVAGTAGFSSTNP